MFATRTTHIIIVVRDRQMSRWVDYSLLLEEYISNVIPPISGISCKLILLSRANAGEKSVKGVDYASINHQKMTEFSCVSKLSNCFHEAVSF